MRSARIALMLTIALAGPYASNFAYAQRPEQGASSRKLPRGKAPQSDRTAETTVRSAVPPDLEQRRRAAAFHTKRAADALVPRARSSQVATAVIMPPWRR